MEINLENKKTKSSFEAGATEVKPKKRYKMQSFFIDKFNTLRKRVLLTPSMCQRANCTFDIAVANGYAGWQDVPEDSRASMLKAFEKHDAEAHSIVEETIINEDQIPKNYLGQENRF